MARLRWSPEAVKDLEGICEYIGRDSLFYAKIFAQDIVALIENTASFPKLGRVVPEYNDPAIRERIFQDYRIVYRISKGSLDIVAIVHGARDFKESLHRRL